MLVFKGVSNSAEIKNEINKMHDFDSVLKALDKLYNFQIKLGEKMSEKKLPLMKQYTDIKSQYQDAMLLF